MVQKGLRQADGSPAAPPYTNGPYTMSEQVNFAGGISGANSPGSVVFVDGTNGSAGGSGSSWAEAVNTIQLGVTAAGVNGTVYVAPKTITDFTGDPTSYAETVIIPATHTGLSLIGISRGRTQGGLPQIKKGSGSTALLTIRAAGCLIANMGFNGGSSTGGGILLDDDYSAKTAFGTSIVGCHFKNCVGSTATNAATGGAIQWSATGNAWQVSIIGNRFYKNVGDVVLLGTSSTVPQDVLIENNVFSGPAANVDCNLYLAGGSGMNGVIINNNIFTCFPAIGSGTNANVLVLTGCIGSLTNNTFAITGKTFGAAGNVLVPTTVLMAHNYQEDGATQIART